MQQLKEVSIIRAILYKIPVIIALSFVNVCGADIDKGLVAHWGFDEGSGVVIYDRSSNSNDGRLYGPKRTLEKYFTALEFDGVNDYIQIPNANSVPPDDIRNLSQGTISIWFKLNSLPQAPEIHPLFDFGTDLLSDYQDTVIIEVGHFGNSVDRNLYFTLGKTGNSPTLCFNSEPVIDVDKWYHFIGVVGPDFNTGYLNGQEMTDRRYNFGDANYSVFFEDIINKAALWIGQGIFQGAKHYFDGVIDDVRIYNRPLNAPEAEQLYHYQPLNGDLDLDNDVDSRDFTIFSMSWMSELGSPRFNPFCDTSQPKDNRIDTFDLAVFSDYWLKDLRLIAHWKLDETEGFIAHDSVGNKDASVAGAIWQPAGGKVGGSLEFDGQYDIVSSGFVLNPAEGAFSAFAWIKGGAPGQVVVSQTSGTGTSQAWLGTDTPNGKLMTMLTDGSSQTEPLISELTITDGQWHHIGVVWNGSRRHLYADGEEVAKDADVLDSLQAADGGLCFGIDNDFDPASCFYGLIDDVRIYNVALTAAEIDEMVR